MKGLSSNLWRLANLLIFCILLFALSPTEGNKKRPNTDSKKDSSIGKSISSFKPGGQYALLTFSGGPHAIYTPQLLDILKRMDVKASFFVHGRAALLHPAIITRMAAEGHDIGQQGYFHKLSHLPNVGTDFFPAPPASSSSSFPVPWHKVSAGINETSALLENLIKEPVRFYRPPAAFQPFLHELVPYINTHHAELQVILSSLDSQDRLIDVGVASANVHFVEHIVQKLVPGDIILLHDSQRVTLQSLELLLTKANEAGYEFLTLTRILTFPDDSPK
jgi:peptidoglycan/xylan/chitin deacetylase (PgdA/CDA1 family)